MVKTEHQIPRASRDVWISAAIEVLHAQGAVSIQVMPLARHLGLTSGSFYWHFKNVQDLLDGVLDHWESHLTDNILKDAQAFNGPPKERILSLMLQVVREEAAVPDHAISAWAKNDAHASTVYSRTIQKRVEFAKWMFSEAGFSSEEAGARGGLLVTSLMGNAMTDLTSNESWEKIVHDQWRVLVSS